MTECRCKKCNKLLAKIKVGVVEIVCKKCKEINVFEKYYN